MKSDRDDDDDDGDERGKEATEGTGSKRGEKEKEIREGKSTENANAEGDPLFCYMIVNFLPQEKINTHIGFSCNPMVAVRIHNSGEIKATKSAAPGWSIQMIVGPMSGREHATRSVSCWKHGRRGIMSRIERGVRLASDERLVCWDASCRTK